MVITNNRTIEYWMRSLKEDKILKLKRNHIRNNGYTIVSIFLCRIPDKADSYIICKTTYNDKDQNIRNKMYVRESDNELVEIFYNLYDNEYIITPNNLEECEEEEEN